MSSNSTGQSENSSDFVTPNVNECLQQARKVLAHGTVDPNPNERVLQESTSVKVSHDKSDKIEVVIRRSAVSQQDTDDEIEEFTSYSDSELPHYGPPVINLYRVGSQENLLKKKHTIAKYKRRHGECWRKADLALDGEVTDDEAEIEVDVKEEECLSDGGGHIVKTTWEARWTVQSYECLPDWLQDNEYLRDFHRPPLPSFAECFKSIWSLHTETGNIWTHLIGCVAFFCLAVWYLFRSDIHIQLQEKVVFSFFFIGAIVCLGLSFTFHTVSCHSFNVSRLFSKLDYMGISLLIIGSFIPWVYYGFYCRPEPKFHSHQLFHVCVVCAAFAHYYGISEMAMNRLTSSCPSTMDSITDSSIKHSEL